MSDEVMKKLDAIRDEMTILYSRADALKLVGNKDLGFLLAKISTDVFYHCDWIEAELSSVQTQRVKDAEQASLNVLAAAVAGIEVGKHEDH